MGLNGSIEAAAVPLPSVLDLANAAILQRLLVERCEQDSAIVLDGSQVERVSTACLQVLVATAQAARTHGRAFRLTAASPCLSAAIADLGLARHLLGEVTA
jgi:anti-anti-sigma regulatory factor